MGLGPCMCVCVGRGRRRGEEVKDRAFFAFIFSRMESSLPRTLLLFA